MARTCGSVTSFLIFSSALASANAYRVAIWSPLSGQPLSAAEAACNITDFSRNNAPFRYSFATLFVGHCTLSGGGAYGVNACTSGAAGSISAMVFMRNPSSTQLVDTPPTCGTGAWTERTPLQVNGTGCSPLVYGGSVDACVRALETSCSPPVA